MFEIGNTLREARLRQGHDFRQVEQATKIRGRYLRALEEEDFDALPAETYIRGFLRSYAEFLGLDGQLYVDEYNSRYVTGEEQPVLRPRRSPPKRGGGGAGTSVMLLALTAITVMTALVIAAWKFSAGPSGSTAQPVAAKPPAGGSKPHASPPAKVARANLFVAATRGNCWLEVHADPANGDVGRLLYQGTLEKGQTQRFVARKLWVSADVPKNLVVRLNGEQVAIGADKPVAVVITADSITSAAPQ